MGSIAHRHPRAPLAWPGVAWRWLLALLLPLALVAGVQWQSLQQENDDRLVRLSEWRTLASDAARPPS